MTVRAKKQTTLLRRDRALILNIKSSTSLHDVWLSRDIRRATVFGYELYVLTHNAAHGPTVTCVNTGTTMQMFSMTHKDSSCVNVEALFADKHDYKSCDICTLYVTFFFL